MKLSIRKFLLFNLLGALVLTTFLTALANYYFDQQEIHSDLDNQLSQSAFMFKILTEDSLQTENIKDLQKRLDRIAGETKTFFTSETHLKEQTHYKQKYQFQIWNLDNRLLLHSANASLQPLYADKTGFSTQYIDGEAWRIFTIIDIPRKVKFVLAQHYGVRDHLAHRITIHDIYTVLVVYPLTGLIIWFILGYGLRSIEKVTQEVSQRAAHNLNPVDTESVPLEVQPLVDELNKLFLRVKQAFEREQRFAADAAHELRTPLAALRTQAQVALKTTDLRQRQLHLQNVLAGVDRCTHVIQQLLTLCRMTPEAITLEDQTPVDMTKVAAEVIVQLAPSAVDKSIEIELIAKDPDCIIMGNITGIHALIRNLVDNAIRYTPEKGSIKVWVSRTADTVLLRVIDNGPGIPAELRSRVFERFFRVLGTSVQGSGLGLAIVQQIVKLHKGSVRLGVPENGIGLEVELSLPAILFKP